MKHVLFVFLFIWSSFIFAQNQYVYHLSSNELNMIDTNIWAMKARAKKTKIPKFAAFLNQHIELLYSVKKSRIHRTEHFFDLNRADISMIKKSIKTLKEKLPTMRYEAQREFFGNLMTCLELIMGSIKEKDIFIDWDIQHEQEKFEERQKEKRRRRAGLYHPSQKSFLERNFIHLMGVTSNLAFLASDWDSHDSWEFVPVRHVSDLWEGGPALWGIHDKALHFGLGATIALVITPEVAFYIAALKEIGCDLVFREKAASVPDFLATCAGIAPVYVWKKWVRNDDQRTQKKHIHYTFVPTLQSLQLAVRW